MLHPLKRLDSSTKSSRPDPIHLSPESAFVIDTDCHVMTIHHPSITIIESPQFHVAPVVLAGTRPAFQLPYYESVPVLSLLPFSHSIVATRAFIPKEIQLNEHRQRSHQVSFHVGYYIVVGACFSIQYFIHHRTSFGSFVLFVLLASFILFLLQLTSQRHRQ